MKRIVTDTSNSFRSTRINERGFDNLCRIYAYSDIDLYAVIIPDDAMFEGL